MTDATTPLPPARERNRHGIRSFHAAAPAAREALLDRVEIRLRGTVISHAGDGLERLISRISTGSAAHPLFGRPHRRGGRWEARCLSGSTISGGELVIFQRGGEASVHLTLVVNPIRTLGHLLDRYEFDQIEGLEPSAFFARSPAPSASSLTLDQRDNMVTDLLAFGGTWHHAFVQRVANYLGMFEAALKRRIVEELCPPDYGYAVEEAGSVVYATNHEARLSLDWGSLTLSQCEVCWERYDPAALEAIRSLADATLAAARSASVSTHELLRQASVERVVGAVSVKVPIVRDRIAWVAYAKAPERVRLEVRYTGNLPEELRDRLPDAPRRLTDWFDAVRDEATTRLPWAGIQSLLRPIEVTKVSALADLLEAVADVTDRAKSKRRSLLCRLLTDGAVTATNRDGDAPSTILQRLADRGVLEHVRLVSRDAHVGRRYRLTDRYRALAQAGVLAEPFA